MELAVDGGQTGLRTGLAADGRVLLAAEGPGLSYAAGRPVDVVMERVVAAWRELGRPEAGIRTICLGLTTLLGSPEADQELADRLFAAFPARRVLITTDVVTAHAGAFGGRPGVVLAAGTGSIALGVAGYGAIRQVDGWGYLCGDAGGGLWIGSRGLDAAFRGLDGRRPPGPLTARAGELFGDLATLPERLYLAPDAVARVAGFAVHVLELAGTDETARSITAEAARELATSVTAAARCFAETAEVPVSWTGRLLGSPILSAGFRAELGTRLPRARLSAPAGDGLSGAALLAAGDPGHYRTLIKEFER
ncbi:N-acetylglucosamine kinase [Nonomuraea sp. LPB2021202275-12-8]|uniref:N-acetylglucosamine kinase n=1 Tax=Nonomuraea sp. LPB2021202275-12-8 TaxID=3120159 RepID=UPI00300CF4EB